MYPQVICIVTLVLGPGVLPEHHFNAGAQSRLE